MKPTPNSNSSGTRLDREVERERVERERHDDEKSGVLADEEFRSKDARDNASATHLSRSRSY
ncbi:MAG: hypothetical protein ABIT83_22010 [Massilia sp.]